MLNNPLNNLLTIKSTAIERSNLFTSGVFEAVVLSSSPLLNNDKQQKSYQINLQLQPSVINTPHKSQQTIPPVIELISQQPFPKGSKVQLQINNQQTATLISVTDVKGQVILGKPIEINTPTGKLTNTALTTNNTANSQATQTPPANQDAVLAQTNPKQTNINKTASSSVPLSTNNQAQKAAKPTQSPEAILQQAKRESLPLQQQPNIIASLLQQLTQNKTELPGNIAQQIKTLLANLPTNEQLEKPATLKKALLNSGAFFEAKLSHLVKDHHNRQNQLAKLTPEQLDKLPSTDQLKARDAAIINADNKANIQKLITQIEQILGKSILKKSQPLSEKGDEPTQKIPQDKALLQPTANKTTVSSNKENIDIVLQQLGRQLLASLAKTQLNQLETLQTRNQSSSDPVINNSWTLEIPIIHGKQADNLQLSIQEEQGSDKKTNKLKQWRVILDFDLHKLGKMSVELVIIEKQVSATIWSELKQAHSLVQKEIEGFRENLEKIGVSITHIECKIGLPPKNNNNLQPLVDIRT